jgi:hypothetical protein
MEGVRASAPARASPLALLALLALLGPGGAPARAEDEPAPEIRAGELREWVRRLADDELEGREAGTPACDRAADLVAAEFARLGLKPVAPDGGWFQPFARPKGIRVLATSTVVATDADGATTEFTVGEDFSPADNSSGGEASGPIAFAGYGVRAQEHQYDDYAGLDVKGRVVVVLRGAPRYHDAKKSPFASPDALTRYATFKAKADLAAELGALALVVVNDPQGHAKPADDILRPPGGSATGRIPVVHFTWRSGKRLGSRVDLSFTRLQRAIDAKLNPAGALLDGPTLRVRCDVVPDDRRMKNVLGLLEPDAPTTGEAGGASSRETVVVGAHYDHVGLGHFGSLANATGEIHNGADDNASGTSALIEVAGWLAARRTSLRRRVLFVAFSGEELGLLGSKHYVQAPLVPNDEVVAMLNLDMVGRLDKNRLFVGGTGTSPVWPAMIERLNGDGGRFDLVCWPGGKAPSDHTSFYEANIPVLFLFTGLHGDYHRPSDDPRTLNYAGHERVAAFAAALAFEAANLPERPQFTRCDAGGFAVGPYTGLNVEQRPEGVFVAHVDKKSPAQQAGVKEGDRIDTVNDQPVPDTNRWNELVSNARPSEKFEMELDRDGKRRRVRLKLGST